MSDPFDARTRSLEPAHHEHVEPDGEPREIGALLQQLQRRARDALLLAPVDARGGPAECRARARAHLGDHQHAALAGDEVELAEAPAVIALENLAALRAQEFGGELLRTLASTLSLREHPCSSRGCAAVSCAGASWSRRSQRPQFAVMQLRPDELAPHPVFGVETQPPGEPVDVDVDGTAVERCGQPPGVEPEGEQAAT